MKWYGYAQRDGLERQTIMELGEIAADNFQQALDAAKWLAKGKDIPGVGPVAFVVRTTPLEIQEYAARYEALTHHDRKRSNRHKKQRKVKDVYIPERDGIWADGLKGVK